MLATLAAVVGFGAWNAGNLVLQGKGAALRPAILALFLAAALTLGAVLAITHQALLVQVFLGAAVTSYIVSMTTSGRPPRDARFEFAGIVALCWLGAGIAVAGGSSARVAIVVELTLALWFCLSLWFVKAKLASVLKRREPWAHAPRYTAGLASVVALLALASQLWWVLLVIPAYGARVRSQPQIEGPRQIRELGMAEARWSLAVVIALSTMAQFA